MAEFTYAAVQTVDQGQNIVYNATPVPGCKYIVHRDGSGIVTLRGITQQCFARFKVSFGANIAVPTGGTVEAISVALAIDGEPLATSMAIVTPAAVEEYFNVFVEAYVDVPHGCCEHIAVENNTDQSILVQNANLIVEKVA